jgi:TRAP-type mannitol/chloroaromatic compound transport system substrate-binding protein
MKTTTVLAAVLALATTAASNLATAQEVTLKAVTSFAEKTQFSKNFERFIDKVNADGKGVIQINYIGGPRAMPPFEVGNAVRTKVVDIANVTGAFYTNLMPEADALKLISKPAAAAQRTAPSRSSSNCITTSSTRTIWRGSSTTCRSTSISIRRSTSSTSPG